MLYAICNLSIVPLRAEPSDKSELVSQILYGEVFKLLEQRKHWSKIQLTFDNYEGWVDNKQFIEISEPDFETICAQDPILSTDLLEVVHDAQQQLTTIPLGSSLNGIKLMGQHYDGHTTCTTNGKEHLISTAFLYLNAPYLWGGKTPFGIDCSGFTQMVYKLNGYHLFRDASQQAGQGQPLSFIEESETGDLAFFDNSDGEIVHVGIIMEDNYIIHAHGKVRIDRLDHSGIYNAERNMHTHKLRVIKKII